MQLQISPKLSLPLQAVTMTQAILASKGAGKTYTASVEAEEMLKAGQQVIAIDPTGAWWGLKSSANGRSAGFSIPIFGGEHADVPLEETAGETIAQAIVEHRLSAILDLSLLRKGAMRRFVTSFLETLYHVNRSALALFVDEADLFSPQRVSAGDERMLGAMEDIVRRGRIRGIGTTLITQRPAVLNKDVLTQCEALVCLRMGHPRDISAIREWTGVHGDEEHLDQMRRSLPALPRGTAWFWIPTLGIFQRVGVRERETFNSSATPEPGKIARLPRTLAEVDLAELGAKIQATVQQGRENDPKELKRRIAELRQRITHLEAKQSEVVRVEVPVNVPVEVPAVSTRDIERLTKVVTQLAAAIGPLDGLARTITEALQRATIARQAVPSVVTPPAAPAKRPDLPAVPPAQHGRAIERTSAIRGAMETLPAGERAILAALAEKNSAGSTRRELTVVTSYKRSSRDAYLQRLRAKGFVEERDGRILLTSSGRDALGPEFRPLPVDKAELRRVVLGKLPVGEARILEYLINVYPTEVGREELSDALLYKRSSRDAYLQRLAARELITVVGSRVRAAAELL